ncbi:hypothetical protein GN958_ATG03660, partial [Phytophthora infestans]
FALLGRVNGASSQSTIKTEADTVLTHRLLRRHARSTFDKGGDALEDRVIGIKVPGTAMIKSLVKSGEETLTKLATRSTSDKQKLTGNIFRNLNVGASKTKLLESESYQAWARSVSKLYKKRPQEDQAAMFQTLVAMRLWPTFWLKHLEKAQIDNWLAQRKTVDDIYDLLKLDTVDNIFLSPSLETWISYTTRLKTVRPHEWLAVKLTKWHGEDGLARMVAAAKSDTRNLPGKYTAMSVDHALTDSWLKEGKTLDDAFRLLRLDTASKHNVLENPALNTWVLYVKDLKEENAFPLMFVAMQNRYGDDVANELWRIYLKLEKGDNLFKNSALGTWTSYVNSFYKTGKKQDEYAAVSVLEKRFGDDMDLARMLYRAEKDATVMKETIAGLRSLQFKKWYNANMTPDIIPKRLTERKDAING